MRATGWIAAIVAVIISVVAFVYSRRPTIATKPPAALAQRQEQRPHYLSTAARYGRRPFDVLTELTSGNVWIPAAS